MGEVDEGAGEGAVREGGVNTEDWEGNGFRGDLSGYMKIGYIMFTSCHKLQNPTSDTSKFTAGFSIKMEEGSPIPAQTLRSAPAKSWHKPHHGCCPSRLQNRP